MHGLCRRHLLDRIERGTGQRSTGSMLEAGAEVEVARVFETNDRVAADRILCPGGAMWHRAGRGRMEPEISAESMATVQAVNVCYYQRPEPEMVERILQTPEVAEGWKRMFAKKLGLESRQPE